MKIDFLKRVIFIIYKNYKIQIVTVLNKYKIKIKKDI